MQRTRTNPRKTRARLAGAIRGSVEFHQLESRVLQSANPLVSFSGGLLSIAGTSLDDQITVSCSGNSWTIGDGAWSVTKTLAVTKVNINGKAGNDLITVDSSVTVPVTLNGDTGNDTLVAASGATSLVGGAGDDQLVGGSGNDTLVGGAGNDTLLGNAGNDKLYGGAGDDWINGGDGDDFIQGGLGNDFMAGGVGTNTLDYSDHTIKQGVTIQLDGTGVDGMSGELDCITAEFQVVNGSQGNDCIVGANADEVLNGLGGNDTLIGGAADDRLYGGAGNDVLLGGDGDDSLYGGTGNDSLDGGNGNDLLITIGGGTASTLAGGAGNDTFWTDSNLTETVTDLSAYESSIGAWHQVNAFQRLRNIAVSKDLNGQALTDPVLKGKSIRYINFRNDPLFADSGPSINDINQGALGDCYFLAQLGSFAEIDPTLIQQSIVNLGDGTFAVEFVRNSRDYFYRIDADLPAYSTTMLAYAGFGAQNSIWTALYEKAWAFFRTGAGTYASIEGGWMGSVSTAFGKSSTWGYVTGDTNAIVSMLKDSMAAGESVTVATYASQVSGSLMVGNHAYSVEAINGDGNGGYTITVRNPWAIDGYTCADGVNDGYVTLTVAQFSAEVQAYSVADA